MYQLLHSTCSLTVVSFQLIINSCCLFWKTQDIWDEMSFEGSSCFCLGGDAFSHWLSWDGWARLRAQRRPLCHECSPVLQLGQFVPNTRECLIAFMTIHISPWNVISLLQPVSIIRAGRAEPRPGSSSSAKQCAEYAVFARAQSS